jgi:hypothetical protein
MPGFATPVSYFATTVVGRLFFNCVVYSESSPERPVEINATKGKKGKPVNLSKQENNDMDLESLLKLIQIMRKDPVLNERVIQMLKLNPYQRRNVINNWLEQLSHQNASKKLRLAFSFLFDDSIAEKVLTLIDN